MGCAVDASGVPGRDGDDTAVNDAFNDSSLPDGAVALDLGRDLGIDLGPELDMAMADDLGVDQGAPDMGAPDMGAPDMGPPDMGPPDMGPPDMGPPDMGPPDMFIDGGCGTDESCNARDDDCDGLIDENPGGPRGENVCPLCTRAVSPNGVTYQICPSRASWTVARDACRLTDYELASPETMNEDSFLDSVLIDGDDYWIGLNERDHEGWEWEDQPTDRPLGTTFDDWRRGEPNGSGECVRIALGTLKWRDTNCGASHYFVCEAP